MDVKLEDLKVRFLTSITFGVALGLLIYFSTHLVVRIVLAAVVALILVLAQYELYHITVKKGLKGQWVSYLAAPCYLATVLMSLYKPSWEQVGTIVIGGVIALLFLQQFLKTDKPISSISASLLGIFYLVLPLSFALKLIYFEAPSFALGGRWWAYFLIVVTKAGDVGAYFIGKMVGRHYLVPKISPKKTYEGLFAGIAASVGASYVFIYLTPSAKDVLNPTWAYALGFGVTLGLIGFIGDLSESLLKREANVKDSNKLKGFGGILDMVDSLIFTTPAFYLFLKYGHFL